jgi:hypothetical protein
MGAGAAAVGGHLLSIFITVVGFGSKFFKRNS